MASNFTLAYKPGPDDRTLWAFLKSDAFVRGFMGPLGGGKTSAGLMDMVIRSAGQARSPIDGVRYSRWAIFRDTYRELERTTLKTWNDWVPRQAGEWRGGANGEPARHHLRKPLADGSMLDAEFLFIAVGDRSAEAAAGGFEITGALLNEGSLLDRELFDFITGRVGRYPPQKHGGPTWSGVSVDFNAPDYDNWCYDVFVENRPDLYAFFQQPGGLDDTAENLQNLPGGRTYYERMSVGKPDWWTRRLVHNQFGYSRDGKPVHPDFDETVHMAAKPIAGNPLLPLWIGLDAGRHPAAAICQLAPDGQLRCLDELVTHHIGPKEFGAQLKHLLHNRYEHYERKVFADPAAMHPTELSENNEHTWIEMCAVTLREKVKPASTNDTPTRREALGGLIRTPIGNAVPGVLISPGCHTIRRGLANRFRYKRVGNTGSQERYHGQVDKNDESHVCEALEYAAMMALGKDKVTGRRVRSGKPAIVTHWQPQFG